MDWKDSLQNWLLENPDLPQGEEKKCDTIPNDTLSKALPRLDIILDKKGRKGKTATIVTGFDPEDEKKLREIATRLKSALGTGGSARDGEILIQGDRRNDVADILAAMGYKTRLL